MGARGRGSRRRPSCGGRRAEGAGVALWPSLRPRAWAVDNTLTRPLAELRAVARGPREGILACGVALAARGRGDALLVCGGAGYGAEACGYLAAQRTLRAARTASDSAFHRSGRRDRSEIAPCLADGDRRGALPGVAFTSRSGTRTGTRTAPSCTSTPTVTTTRSSRARSRGAGRRAPPAFPQGDDPRARARAGRAPPPRARARVAAGGEVGRASRRDERGAFVAQSGDVRSPESMRSAGRNQLPFGGRTMNRRRVKAGPFVGSGHCRGGHAVPKCPNRMHGPHPAPVALSPAASPSSRRDPARRSLARPREFAGV